MYITSYSPLIFSCIDINVILRMDRFPTVHSLAAASAEDVNVLWAGLGYYRRAAQIRACAKLLVAEYGGELPQTAEALKKLPGIGRCKHI